ncbi:alpha/beta hydrolase family protein [Persephonella sp.]
MLKRLFILLFFVGLGGWLTACNNDSPVSQTQTTALVEAQLVATLKSDQVDTALQTISSAGVTSTAVPVSPYGVFGFKAFRVVYWTTDDNGNRVKASGLVVFPDTASLDPNAREYFQSAIVSDQHGTIFLDSEAPTNAFMDDVRKLLSGDTPTSTTFGLVIYYTGAYGFTAVMPDYIGYGESVDHYHTYMLENSLANATVDLLKAAVELAQQMKVPVKKEVYLAGYSEGGYATMAAAKRLQQDSMGFTVKGVFPMGGVYDLETMGLGIISAGNMDFPPFPAYLTYAYGETYSDVVLSELVKPEFVDQLPVLFDKQKDAYTIYGLMFQIAGKTPGVDTFSVTDFYTLTALDSFVNNPDYPFRARLRENNVDDWVPLMPMVFVHCNGDDILPQTLAYSTYQKFVDSGAPAVQFVDPEVVFGTASLGHSDCAVYAYKVLLGSLCQMEYGSCN